MMEHRVAPRPLSQWPAGGIIGGLLLGVFLIPALGRLVEENRIVSGGLAFLPFFLLVFATTLLINRGHVALPRKSQLAGVTATIVWLILLVTSILRSNNENHVGAGGLMLAGLWGSIVGASLLIASDLSRRPKRTVEASLHANAGAAGVFAIANVLLQLVGVESREVLLVDFPEGRLAALLGLRIDRTLLPLARGVNNFGVVAGLGLAGAIAMMLTAGPFVRRSAAGVLVAGCLVALVLVDSRGPLVFGLISGVGVVALFRTGRGLSLRWLAFIVPALPLILLLILAWMAQTEMGQALSRQQDDILSATGRTFIWAAAAGQLAAYPQMSDLVGYGQYGAKGAGISTAWASRFEAFESDPTLASTHNVTLQLVYDVGYLGLVAVLSLCWWMLSRLARLRNDC